MTYVQVHVIYKDNKTSSMLLQGSHTVSPMTITPNYHIINDESGTYNGAPWQLVSKGLDMNCDRHAQMMQ